jgi:hypothetical protein
MEQTLILWTKKQFPAKAASIKNLKTYCWTNWIQTLNATDYYVLYVISKIYLSLSIIFYIYISLLYVYGSVVKVSLLGGLCWSFMLLLLEGGSALLACVPLACVRSPIIRP